MKKNRGESQRKKPKFQDQGEWIEFEKITLTKNQEAFQKLIEANAIIFCCGPAGTSKTFTSLYTSLLLLLKPDSKYKQIVLTKPIEESGEKLGHLPGELDDKTAPYSASFYHTVEKIIQPKGLSVLLQQKSIEFKPLAYMRGSSFDHSIMILDEAQNTDFRQLMLYITRLGRHSKMIILGDTSQYDIKQDQVGLTTLMNITQGIGGVASFEFTDSDIVRNPILIKIVRRYEEYKATSKLPRNKG